jgi:hypothetical protein
MEAEVAVSGEMHDKDDHRRTTVEKRRHKRRRLSGPGVFHLESPFLDFKELVHRTPGGSGANMRERRSKAEEE